MNSSRDAKASGGVDLGSVEALVAPRLVAIGYELVLVELISTRGPPSLRISIDRQEPGQSISLDDCVRVTRLLEDMPELDKQFPGAYNLEVSSPGVNRPLVREGDFVRFVGEKAQICVNEPIDGRRRFTGRILGVDGGEVALDLGKSTGTVSIRLDGIAKANLKPDTADLFGKTRQN